MTFTKGGRGATISGGRGDTERKKFDSEGERGKEKKKEKKADLLTVGAHCSGTRDGEEAGDGGSERTEMVIRKGERTDGLFVGVHEIGGERY